MFPRLVNNLIPVKVRASATITADENWTAVDLKGCLDGVEFLIDITAVGAGDASNYFTFYIEESPDNTNWTRVDRAERYLTPYNRSTSNPQPVVPTPIGQDQYGEGPFVTKSTATGQFLIGLAPGVMRYVRVAMVETGTASVTLSAFAFKHPRQMPRPGITGFANL